MIIWILLGCLTACSSYAPPKVAEQQVALGLYYLHQGDVITAKKKLLLAVAANPTDVVTLDAFAFFNEKTGELAVAQKYYQLALTYAPKNGMALNNYGAFLYRKHDYQGALAHFVAATSDLKYLEVGKAYHNAGLAALKLHKPELAKGYFAKAQQLNLALF